jgi:hypothetical protein
VGAEGTGAPLEWTLPDGRRWTRIAPAADGGIWAIAVTPAVAHFSREGRLVERVPLASRSEPRDVHELAGGTVLVIGRRWEGIVDRPFWSMVESGRVASDRVVGEGADGAHVLHRLAPRAGHFPLLLGQIHPRVHIVIEDEPPGPGGNP